MQSPMTRAARTPVVLGLALLTLATTPQMATARSAPTVEQMVVFKSGKATIKKVRAAGLKVKVGHKRCAVGTGTPLAALLRSKVARFGLRDYAACSARARDGGQIYVSSIGGDRARGTNGWVYKVGHKSATSGAADPTGPFGSGLLKKSQRVTWYYGTQQGESFERTLELSVGPGPAAGTARVRVRSYDNDGRGRPEPGAMVRAGSATATTGASGSAVVATGAGRRTFVASKPGAVRSFAESLTVR